MTLPEILKEGRKSAGISQRVASKALGISNTYLSKLENGKEPLPKGLILSISDLYKIPAERLICITKKMPDEIMRMLFNRPDAVKDLVSWLKEAGR